MNVAICKEKHQHLVGSPAILRKHLMISLIVLCDFLSFPFRDNAYPPVVWTETERLMSSPLTSALQANSPPSLSLTNETALIFALMVQTKKL